MIYFHHVSKHFSGQQERNSLRMSLAFRKPLPGPHFTALNDVSFHLKAGDSLGILGRNGAGKSTLLKLLTRVIRPSVGQIRVYGRMSSLLEVGAGFHQDLTGRENIFLSGAILGMPPGKVKSKLDDIVAFSGLSTFLDNPVSTYSSGMFLRLAFSVGVHLDCEILVIDEALAVGDHEFKIQCLAKIQQFRQKGGTLIFVSHDEHQLQKVCTRGLVLGKGMVLYDGDINTALSHYKEAIIR